MMRHGGSVAATVEATLISDGIAAAQRTGKEVESRRGAVAWGSDWNQRSVSSPAHQTGRAGFRHPALEISLSTSLWSSRSSRMAEGSMIPDRNATCDRGSAYLMFASFGQAVRWRPL
jgi:hypothetical protein